MSTGKGCVAIHYLCSRCVSFMGFVVHVPFFFFCVLSSIDE